ncbi:hypothetical protein BGW80DRAFT_1256989 [Lactifluus volemus]|nr:hypothetical protein BGW80DRAFT_1256989 [Lactifluus volemus]
MTPPSNTPDLSPMFPTSDHPISSSDKAVEALITHNFEMALKETEREQWELLQTPTPDGPQSNVHLCHKFLAYQEEAWITNEHLANTNTVNQIQYVINNKGYLKPLGFEGRVTVGPPDPRSTPDVIAGGDNRGVTEEMSEDATGGDVLVGAQAYPEKQSKEQGWSDVHMAGRQEKQQEGGGGENGCYGNAQWHAHSKEWCMHDSEVRETAEGQSWQEWMLWQGAVVCTVGKRPEEQGDEEAAEMDAFMRCSGVHAEERWGR